MLSNHDFISQFGQDKFDKAKMILGEIKLAAALPNETYQVTNEELILFDELIDMLEFVIVDSWDVDNYNQSNDPLFREAATLYIEIVQNLPKYDILTCLKFISFGYLAERWETVRRSLIEREKELIGFEESSQWNSRLLEKIFKSVFYIVRKRKWEDLDNAVKLIAELREEQKKYEKEFLDSSDSIHLKRSDALELTSYYHFAKAVDLVGNYQLSGQPNNVQTEIDFHFKYAIQAAEFAGKTDLNLVLRFVQPSLLKMIDNSIWRIGQSINSRVTKFIEVITKADRPVIELLYPQRSALLEQGLLDVAQKAVVVNMPTSSGKTLLAEFRMLLALNQFSDDKGWVAYVAPTKALVNQITTRLRKDLSGAPLSLKVESLSGALEFDAFDTELMNSGDKKFDILVTTPEKLSLLLRQSMVEKIGRPLALVVIDEAHNLGDQQRGINLEVLLSIIKHDYSNSINLLLLTPFIPNSKEIAKWLNPQASRSIGIELNWQPNDRIIGLFYPTDKFKHVEFHTLQTSSESIKSDRTYRLTGIELSKPRLNTNYKLTAEASMLFNDDDNVLVIAKTKEDTFSIAQVIYDNLVDVKKDPEIELVKKFIKAELGDDFPLANFLDRRIGIHHSGLPDEVRILMESLMENEKLKYLVATTTIAQGINFNISTVLMSSYSYPYTANMPISDFWNLVGRVGRMHQSSTGIIGIASQGDLTSESGKKIGQFVVQQSQELMSVLVQMVRDALKTSAELNLASFFNRPQWSTFLQYIAHTYRQTNDLNKYLAEIELKLMDTFGYHLLDNSEKNILKEAVKNYTNNWLKTNKGVDSLSDLTGFSPNSVLLALKEAREQKISVDDFKAKDFFNGNSNSLKKVINIMLKAPEIKSNLNAFIVGSSAEIKHLPSVIADWVSGASIQQLATKYYKGESDMVKQITTCVSEIYSKLTNNGAWGLAAVQQLSGINFDKLTEEDRNSLSNLPAMILYGVSTNEGIAMRKANVPRSLADKLGALLDAERKKMLYKISNTEIIEWLNGLSEKSWDAINPNKKQINGKEYKEVWKKLVGIE